MRDEKKKKASLKRREEKPRIKPLGGGSIIISWKLYHLGAKGTTTYTHLKKKAFVGRTTGWCWKGVEEIGT